jgi:hypothetical protein
VAVHARLTVSASVRDAGRAKIFIYVYPWIDAFRSGVRRGRLHRHESAPVPAGSTYWYSVLTRGTPILRVRMRACTKSLGVCARCPAPGHQPRRGASRHTVGGVRVKECARARVCLCMCVCACGSKTKLHLADHKVPRRDEPARPPSVCAAECPRVPKSNQRSLANLRRAQS